MAVAGKGDPTNQRARYGQGVEGSVKVEVDQLFLYRLYFK